MKNKFYDDTVVPNRYFDKNGVEIKEGSVILMGGRARIVYMLADGEQLGTDATNPKWIETGRAVACEFGCYPLNVNDLMEAVVLPVDKSVFGEMSSLWYTEGVEVCPYCEKENIFPLWDTETQGYVAVCQHCGKQIMLCDFCVNADDYCGCNWHETKCGVKCFRGETIG